jgi:hypothetical protein
MKRFKIFDNMRAPFTWNNRFISMWKSVLYLPIFIFFPHPIMAAYLSTNWSAALLNGGKQTGEMAFEYLMGGSIVKMAMSFTYTHRSTNKWWKDSENQLAGFF